VATSRHLIVPALASARTSVPSTTR
jgi:hypothetical protein